MDPSLTLGYRIAYGQDLVPDVVGIFPNDGSRTSATSHESPPSTAPPAASTTAF